MSYVTVPKRKLTSEEISQYHNDGVIMVRGLLDNNWLELTEAGVEQARSDVSIFSRFVSRKTKGYQMDAFLWKRIDALRDLIYYSPFAYWAQQIMDTQTVRFFYDQMFVKKPGTEAPTPWHQDITFWPLQGEQICSFWIPLDPVNDLSSGLQYVKGSHKWNNRFKAISPDFNATTLADLELDDVPDINADPESYDLISWDMEPGDVLIFHPCTLHGSSANRHRSRMRRAIALRWTGDDVRYCPTKSSMPINFQHQSTVNGALSGPAFPQILPRHIPAEREYRAKGPEHPGVSSTIQTVVKNAMTAMKLNLQGFDIEKHRQTW